MSENYRKTNLENSSGTLAAHLLHAPPPLAACGFTPHRMKNTERGWIWLSFFHSSLSCQR
jgi:hypothetical protein